MSWFSRLISKPTKQESNPKLLGKEKTQRDGIIISSTSNENIDTTNDKQYVLKYVSEKTIRVPHFSDHHHQLFYELKKNVGNTVCIC